jgi:hypothetical protein
MNAFLMVAQCFEAQYRGLTDAERAYLDHCAKVWPEASPTRIDLIPQHTQSIWLVSVDDGREVTHLLSMKDDVLTGLPVSEKDL